MDEMYIDERVNIDNCRMSPELKQYISDIMSAREAKDIYAWDTLMEMFGVYLKEEYNENKLTVEDYKKLKERFCVC